MLMPLAACCHYAAFHAMPLSLSPYALITLSFRDDADTLIRRYALRYVAAFAAIIFRFAMLPLITLRDCAFALMLMIS